MKKFILSFFLVLIYSMSYSQEDSLSVVKKIYRVLRTDGIEVICTIISQDDREVLVITKDHRRMYIPQYMIKEIKEIHSDEFNTEGQYAGVDRFATRYFITTNGLPINKGDHYVQWNIFGPDFQFGIGKNLGVGVMTSWVGVPIIGSIKKSFILSDNAQFAIGTLVGTGSWAALDIGGVLPFATLSFGNRRSNIAFTGGYGSVWADGNTEGSFLSSVAAMTKIGPKLSLVFDSFIKLPGDNYGLFALLIPGVRWHQGEGKAFQFGFTGVIADGDLIPIPIPMIQWYRTL